MDHSSYCRVLRKSRHLHSPRIKTLPAGTMFESDRRFDIIVRLPEQLRTDLEALKRLPIPLTASGTAGAGGEGAAMSYIPLAEVATLDFTPGPNQISREDGKRRIVVSANGRGRDIPLCPRPSE